MGEIFLIILALASSDAYSLEYKSKLVCKGNLCEKKQEYKGLKEVDLKLTDISGGQCLINLKTEKIFKIESVDQKSTKVVMLSEVEENMLSRDLVFFNSKLFDRSHKIIPCSEVAGVLGNEIQLQQCIKSNGKSVKKLFCEKERIKNF